jgi:hypothetical protein
MNSVADWFPAVLFSLSPEGVSSTARRSLCRLSMSEPIVPPDCALPRLSPWLTFHLDVSNYYVILTLTILEVVEFFRFSIASLPQER